MNFNYMRRRQALGILRNSLTYSVLPTYLFSQNRDDQIQSALQTTPASRNSAVDEELVDVIGLASSQHPAINCDFVLTLFEHMKTAPPRNFFKAQLEDVLAKATATNELAPYRNIPSGVADTIPALLNSAIRKTRCDRLTLQCRALRLLAKVDPAESIRGFLLLTLPRQDLTLVSDECPTEIYDYSVYYQLATDLLKILRRSSESSQYETDMIAIVSTVISGLATTNHLDALVTALRAIDNDTLVLGHVSSTLPAAVRRVSVSPHDFAIAGLSERSFASLFELCGVFSNHDLSLLPILSSYRELVTASLQADKCVVEQNDLVTTYHKPVALFNRLFAGPKSRLKIISDPVQELSQTELSKRRIFPYQSGPWVWEGSGRKEILDGLKRLRFDGRSQPWSEAHRRTSNEWNVSFRARVSDVSTFQDKASNDRASQFLFRFLSFQALLELASTMDQNAAVREEVQSLLMSVNPWQGVPASIWIYCTREYLKSAFPSASARVPQNNVTLPDALRLQMMLLELVH